MAIIESERKFELENCIEQVDAQDKKNGSLERRIKLVSEREDEMWKQFGTMNDNF